MKRASFAVALASVVLALSLVGCSSDDDGVASQAVDKAMLQGLWELDAATSLGFESYVFLADDDTAELMVGDSMYTGTWEISDGKAKLAVEGAQAADVSYIGEKLVLGDESGSRMIFVRGEEEGRSNDGEGDGSSSDEEGSASGVEGSDDSGDVATPGSETPDNPDSPEQPDGEPEEPEELEDVGNELIETDGVEIVDEVIEDIAPVIIVDDEQCAITVTGRGTDFTADPCYRVAFTNKTSQPLFITAEGEFTVAGVPIVPGLGDVAEPGQTVAATMYFPKEELGGGLDLLVDVDGTINIQVDETYEPVIDYPFHMD